MTLPFLNLWTPYTVTITGSTTDPTSGAGASLSGYYFQNGSNLYINVQFFQNAAGTNGSGRYIFNIPPGFTINTSVSGVDNYSSMGLNPVWGSGLINNYGTSSGIMNVMPHSSNSLLALITDTTGTGYFGSASSYAFSNTNMAFSFNVTLPLTPP